VKSSLRLKTALLAAASLAAASAATVNAAEMSAAPPVSIEHAASVGDEAQVAAPTALARKLGIAAFAGAAFAGLARLIGFGRIKSAAAAAGRVASDAAAAGFSATAAAARSVGRALASPLRFTAVMAGLGFFALAGIGLYDIEWAGGLATGAAIVAIGFWGAGRIRRTLTPAPLTKPR